MKLLKSILVALLIMANSIVVATGVEIPVDKSKILNPFPVCLANGQPVIYIRSNTKHLLDNKVSVAGANWIDGYPAILFDFDEFQNFTPEFQTWVVYHECAHWELNHIGSYSGRREYTEHEADCLAAKKLVNSGFSDDQLNHILDQIVVVEAKRIKALPPPDEGMEWVEINTNSRARHVQSCMAEALIRR